MCGVDQHQDLELMARDTYINPITLHHGRALRERIHLEIRIASYTQLQSIRDASSELSSFDASLNSNHGPPT